MIKKYSSFMDKVHFPQDFITAAEGSFLIEKLPGSSGIHMIYSKSIIVKLSQSNSHIVASNILDKEDFIEYFFLFFSFLSCRKSYIRTYKK